MLIVLPISQNDFNNPLNVFAFIKALKHFGPYPKHELLVVTRPSAVSYAHSVDCLVKDLFHKSSFHVFDEDGPFGWPQGPNFYWKQTIEYLKSINNKKPWFWMELDIYPLKPKWADSLEKEYIKCKKPCLGTIQNTTTVTSDHLLINIGRHVQGTAIYPPKLHEVCSVWEYVDRLPTAFDVVCQWEIVPNTHDTRLIQQGFRTLNYKILHTNPFLVKGEDNGDLQGVVTYDQPLDPEAVVHHGCKDTSLADIVTSPEYSVWLNEFCNAKA